MKRKMIFLLAILTSSGLLMMLNAQIPPNLDDNWELKTIKSDEFNDASIDLNKWTIFDKGQYPFGWDYCFCE
jgi:hypothetical protein